MIELETMLMQFCLEASGRLRGDRVLWFGGVPSAETERRISVTDRQSILWQALRIPGSLVTVLHGGWVF